MDLKTRVLVVEDAASMREMIVKGLKELGFKDVLEAEDGEQAFDLLLTTTPRIGLILSDWGMPKCDGLQLLKLVRATPEFKNTPFLMVTAKGEMVHTLEAVQAGVSNFVVKPFTVDILRDKLNAIALKNA